MLLLNKDYKHYKKLLRRKLANRYREGRTARLAVWGFTCPTVANQLGRKLAIYLGGGRQVVRCTHGYISSKPVGRRTEHRDSFCKCSLYINFALLKHNIGGFSMLRKVHAHARMNLNYYYWLRCTRLVCMKAGLPTYYEHCSLIYKNWKFSTNINFGRDVYF